jgi:UDP-N-acetylglucosamine--N-acetylmuramyl-(pentapeptide) pyrophosphoryl-undecaprenol N-acetylglucosamine transferase
MRCVIAGGGTGGHLFPGMAIAEAFIEKEQGNEVLFIGTERGIEAKILKGSRFPLRTIEAMPIKGKSVFGKAKALWSLPGAVSEALSVLKGFQPQIVLGVGGYASGPAVLAASLLGAPRAIHEQNVIPGMTNRLLNRFSHRIFVSFEETKRYFPEKKVIVTGNPIRKQIACARMDREQSGRFTILIFGGSAGARRINEAMMDSLNLLEEIRWILRIFHQAGGEDTQRLSKAYEEKGFDAQVKPFFENMGDYYRMAALVVCRAGAGTLAELAACGRAALLIPYPYAAHNHQWLNAQKLVGMDAARAIEDGALTGRSVSEAILHLYRHPEERMRMENSIRNLGRPKAAQEIVDHCYELILNYPTPTPPLPPRGGGAS